MNVKDINLLYDYNYWANRLMLDTAGAVSVEQLAQPTAFPWGSLRRTLIHTLDAEHMWRNLCQKSTIPNPRLIDYEPFPTLESVTTYWAKEEQAMRGYLNSLTDSDLEQVIRYHTKEGLRERVLWHCLVHVVNHGTQHRGECAQMLTDLGHSPGNIDLTRFLNERQ